MGDEATMKGDFPVFPTSGAMAVGVLTEWPWDAASAMGKVGLWALQGRGRSAAQEGQEEEPQWPPFLGPTGLQGHLSPRNHQWH